MKLTAEQVKRVLFREMLARNKVVVQEYTLGCYYADILFMSKDYSVTEVEVKVQKSDLMKEIQAIRKIQDSKDFTWFKYSDKHGKIGKHYDYLIESKNRVTSSMNFSNYQRPNCFCFCVTEELLELCKDGLKDTPYGIILCHEVGVGTDYFTIHTVKQGKSLHKNAIVEQEKWRMLRKLSYMHWQIRHRKEQS